MIVQGPLQPTVCPFPVFSSIFHHAPLLFFAHGSIATSCTYAHGAISCDVPQAHQSQLPAMAARLEARVPLHSRKFFNFCGIFLGELSTDHLPRFQGEGAPSVWLTMNTGWSISIVHGKASKAVLCRYSTKKRRRHHVD